MKKGEGEKINTYHFQIWFARGVVSMLFDRYYLLNLSFTHLLYHPKAQDKHPYYCVVSGDKKVCVCLNELDLGGVFFPEESKPEILMDPCKKCG